MTDMFPTEPIRRDDILPAFPLIRSDVPTLALADWVRHARRAADRGEGGRSGIMVVRGARPYPVGLFCWRIDHDIAGRRVLVAHHFVALELFDACPITRALVAGADRLAERLGCDSVESVVRREDGTMAACLESAGHRPSGRIYRKGIEHSKERGLHEDASAPIIGHAL
jgi:hypothetical protein